MSSNLPILHSTRNELPGLINPERQDNLELFTTSDHKSLGPDALYLSDENNMECTYDVWRDYVNRFPDYGDRNVLTKKPNGPTELLRASKQDLRESDSKLRTLGLGAVALGTQVFDRARVIILLAPPTVINVMEKTGSPVLAGLAGAGIYAGFNYANGEGLTQGLAAYPKTLEKFNERYPAVVSLFEQSLPGMMQGEKTQHKDENISRMRRVLEAAKDTKSKAGMHLRRSLAGISLGSTAFVATASTRGRSKSEVRKTNVGVTVDGAAGVFAIAAGATAGVKELAMRGHFEMANDINNFLGDNRTWYAAAGLSIAGEYFANRKKAKELREETEEDDFPINEDQIKENLEL